MVGALRATGWRGAGAVSESGSAAGGGLLMTRAGCAGAACFAGVTVVTRAGASVAAAGGADAGIVSAVAA
jgi:hypothetical protein